MAFLLGLGEADKARAVAQRALQTIHFRWVLVWTVVIMCGCSFAFHFVYCGTLAFRMGSSDTDFSKNSTATHPPTTNLCSVFREEGEKYNVWVALLNLEAAHGLPSPDEALMVTFSKAAQYCDQKRLYFALLGA